MQINTINGYNLDQKYNNINKNHNNITFEGIKIKNLIPKRFKTKNQQEFVDETCYRFSNILGVNSLELQDLVRGAGSKKFDLLKKLVSRYNARNYSLAGNLKENPQVLIDTFKLVERPTIEHYNIVSQSDAPIKSIFELFSVAKDKKSLEFAQHIQYKVLDGSASSMKKITDMIKSKNKDKYISNPENFVSYLKLNFSNDEAIKELDKLVESGEYRKRFFDSKLGVKNLMKSDRIKSAFSNDTQFLEENYSRSGVKFLKSLFLDFLVHKNRLKNEDFSEILKMYKSANPENIDIRLDILNKFKYKHVDKKDNLIDNSEIKSMQKLFSKMDNDPSSANFVRKALEDNIGVETIKELNDILDIVPSKKAEIFHKNISRIVKYTNEEDRVWALRTQVENPFFITRRHALLLADSINAGFMSPESRFEKITRYWENKINIMKYNKVLKAQNEVAKASPAPVIEPISVHIPESKLVSTPTPTAKPVVEVAPAAANAETVVKVPKLELNRTFKEAREAKKLRVQNDVNEIIKKKLGQKTYENQQQDYKIGAMVMRLKLLPEIFDSIADTRKLQRAAGQRPRVESRDAVKLYSRINGKNRKLVNYMLKQKDAQGNRLFDVKDIMKQLDNLDQRVANLKSAKGKEFKSQDAKAVYLNKFDELFNQYGKLKPRRKTKKKLA